MRFRRCFALFVSVSLIFAGLLQNPAAAESASLAASPALAVNAKSAVLIEKSTGRVLFQQNAHEKLAPASVTKVMSLLLVCEALNDGRLDLADTVTCSDHAASMGGSQIYLEPGEQMSVEDLLRSVVLGSANDAVVALGEHLAGSEPAFVERMNAKAAELGMADTHFSNACGLDVPEHYTSAWDIALMSRALLLEYPAIRDWCTTWMSSIRNGEFQLANTNKLVRYYPGCTGLKTGYTSGAGHCLAATAERDGMELICAVLHAPSSAERFEAAKTLLDYGFATYGLVEVWPEGALDPVPVVRGREAWVQPVVSGIPMLLAEKTRLAGLERRIVLAESIEAPVAEGDFLGEMVVFSEGQELLRVPLTAAEPVARLTFWDIYRRLLRQLLMG